MGTIFACVLIIVMTICFYISDSPHCRKHIFTKMTKKEKKLLTSEAAKNLGAVLKYEVTYVCPKCGEKYTTTHIEE